MQNNKKVGQVTEEEKNEILTLYERRMALNEILQCLKNNTFNATIDPNELYKKVAEDFGNTSRLFMQWWNHKAQKYQWKSMVGGSWYIDFEANDIYIIENH